MFSENGDRCHRFWPTYSIDIIVEGKRKVRGKEIGKRERNPPEKRIGYRVIPDVNKIGRPKAVTSFPILLRHYRQLPLLAWGLTGFFQNENYCKRLSKAKK